MAVRTKLGGRNSGAEGTCFEFVVGCGLVFRFEVPMIWKWMAIAICGVVNADIDFGIATDDHA